MIIANHLLVLHHLLWFINVDFWSILWHSDLVALVVNLKVLGGSIAWITDERVAESSEK